MATDLVSPRSSAIDLASPKSLVSDRSINSPAERSAERRNVSISVNSNFIKASKEDETLHDAKWAWQRRQANRVMRSVYVANLMTVVILADAFCTIVDIDYRASELGVRQAFGHWMLRLDMFIIVAGYTPLFLHNFAADVMLNIGFVPILRMVRVLRLARLLKRLRAFRELQKLVCMMATCLKALFWSFVFCFMIMTVRGMLIVEFVHRIMKEIESLETSDMPNIAHDSPDCVLSTCAVMEANLLLFKTVIAGDSWGKIAVPVIRQHPATAIIFCGSLLTLVFGVLNLELIHDIVAKVLGNARSPHSANNLLTKALGADANLSAESLLKLPISKVLHIDKLAQINITVKNASVSHLNTWTAMDIYSPKPQELFFGMDLAELDLQLQLKLGILPGRGPVGGTELNEEFAVALKMSELSLAAKAFLALNATRLGTFTTDQLAAVGCLASGLDAAAALQADFGATSFKTTLTPRAGSGDLEDDVDHMLNSAAAFLLGASPFPALPI
eukprot:s2877_g3.t1